MLEILQFVQDLTRHSPGCLGCWLSEEGSVDGHVLYVEQWRNEEKLKAHLRSDLYRRVLTAMELSKLPPEVSFHYTSKVKGFELVESLRTSQADRTAAVHDRTEMRSS